MSHQHTVKNTIISRDDWRMIFDTVAADRKKKLFFFLLNLVRWLFGRPLNWSQNAAKPGLHANASFTKKEKKRKGEKKCSAAFLHPRAVELEKLKDERKRDVRRRQRRTGTRQVCAVVWIMATMWMATRWEQKWPRRRFQWLEQEQKQTLSKGDQPYLYVLCPC